MTCFLTHPFSQGDSERSNLPKDGTVHELTSGVSYPPTHTLTHSHTHPLTLSHTFSPTHTLTHSLTHPLTHSLSHTFSPTHTLTHSLTHPLTHSLTHFLFSQSMWFLEQLLEFENTIGTLQLSQGTNTHTHTHTHTHERTH